MDDSKSHPRKMRITGLGREVSAAQLLALGSMMMVLAAAVSRGWLQTLLGLVALVLLGITVLQIGRLRRQGVTLLVELDDSPTDTPAQEDARQDEPQDETDTPIEPAEPQGPHWTETPYPDPDEELYPERNAPSEGQASQANGDDAVEPHWSETAYPDPDRS